MTPSNPLSNNRAQDEISAGEAALEESRYQDAGEHFKKALRMGAATSEQEAHLRCQLSESFERRGLYREALDAVGKYEKMPEFVRLSDRAQMSILIRLGWSYIFLSNIPRSIAFFNHAMTVAQQLNDDAGSGACCFGLGRAYRGLNELAIARDQYTTGLDHYRRLGDWRSLAESYIFIGQISAHEGDYRSSLYSLKQALAIIGDHDEQNLRGRVYTYLAVFYDHQGQTDKALASWERAIEHFRISNNQPLLALNYNNLADKLVYLGEWARAEELLKAAIEIAKETLGVTTVGGSLDTLAQLYLLRGQIGEADRLLEESLQVLLSIKSGEWAEVSTLITIGRSHLMKQQVDQAEEVLSRAVEMCERSGDNHYISEARLWLSDACLRQGDISRASSLVETVRSYLVEAAHIKWWGLMMRMAAKIEAAKGHIAAAIQSLGQSTSIFEIRGSVYDVAVNRVALAEMLERQDRNAAATSEIEIALEVFQRLGAASDEQNARSRLAALKQTLVSQSQASEQPRTIGDDLSQALPASFQAGPDLVSMIDGFTTRRLVQAAVFRDLLLHELASIIRQQANSRAALVAEVDGDGLKLSTSVGLDKNEKAEAIRFLGTLSPEERGEHFVYSFNDRRRTNYFLYVIAPRSERFVTGTISLEPLLDLVKLSLEVESQRSKSRRPQVFDPARLLSQVALPGFICASRAISLVLEQIHKIRSSDVTVLITGESGSGKELIARAVHASSSRRFNTFLPFNCSAAPRDMIESQLFGHKKGAFTGAIANNEGLARAAERGTLFLDEIGDLPLDLQPKLLRFLQEGEVHPIGESKPQKVDVRVVAATNSELERAVSEGRFREDLFHRLNVIRIHVPPLRQRREEIPALINYYLTLYQKEAAKSGIMLSEEAMDLLVVYDWPGNVRQLCNEVRRIVAYSESGAIVTEEALSEEIVKATRELEAVSTVGTKKGAEPQPPLSASRTLADAINEVERQMIQDALRRSSGNIARAAKELGLTRRGLYMKMDRLNFKA